MTEVQSSSSNQDGFTSTISDQVRLGALSLEISMILTREDELPPMLSACTNALVHHLEAAFARIWLLNEAENMLELQASSGMYTHLNGAHGRVPVGSFKIGRIAATKKAHLTNSVIGDPQVSAQAWAEQEGMVAFAGYPLLVGERLIGVMAMFARHTLNDATLQTMMAIANSIALGTERIRLLQREQNARIEAEQAHQRMHSLFMQAPALICVLQGPDHIFEFANPGYQQLIHHRDIIGKPVRKAFPESVGNEFVELLDQIYHSGKTFHGIEVPVQIDRQNTGVLEESYFNFVYQPTTNQDGQVDGILVHAVEVTEQVHARETIKGSEQRLAMAQRVGHIGTFEWNIQTNQVYWTPNLEALYNLPPGSFEGKYENWRQRVHPDDIEAAERNLQEAISGGPPYNAEFRVLWPDNSIHWLLGKGEITHYDEKGLPLHMLGVNIDITERKEAEKALATLNATLEAKVEERTEVLHHLNAELQRSNQELQEFAYVASHDLQEPLRKIQAFGNLLEEEYGSVLEDGKSYLNRMRNAAGRMRILIDDLLTFSRVTTQAVPFVPIDLNVLVSDVIDDLDSRLQTTKGHIETSHLPIIDADGRQMYQMFQNLLSNALKFHQIDLSPLVHISAEIQDNPSSETSPPEQLCVLSIQDNGIGFDEKYLDRIFTVFQRLHGKSNYEGTGIGLAVVRKIVERHNGTITAKSSPGLGATFLITLPMKQKRIKETDSL
jgi:PAS domain S-box-containing protein